MKLTILLLAITLVLKSQVNIDTLNMYDSVRLTDTIDDSFMREYYAPNWENVRIERQTKTYVKQHPKEPYITIWYSGNLVCEIYVDKTNIINEKVFLRCLLILSMRRF